MIVRLQKLSGHDIAPGNVVPEQSAGLQKRELIGEKQPSSANIQQAHDNDEDDEGSTVGLQSAHAHPPESLRSVPVSQVRSSQV